MNEMFRNHCREAVERACREILGSYDTLTQKTLFESMAYSLFAGGKRVRPRADVRVLPRLHRQ